jgi:hypothetical protein
MERLSQPAEAPRKPEIALFERLNLARWAALAVPKGEAFVAVSTPRFSELQSASFARLWPETGHLPRSVTREFATEPPRADRQPE